MLLVGGCANQPQLLLNEVFAYDLPDDFILVGADARSTDNIVLWATNQQYLIHVKPDSTRRFGHGVLRRPVAASMNHDNESIQIVDDDALVVMNVSGEVLSESRVLSGVSILSAARRSNRWMLAGIRWDTGDFEIHIRDSAEAHLVTLPPLVTPDSTVFLAPKNRWHVAWASDTALIATRLNPPFENLLVHTHGHVIRRFQPNSGVHGQGLLSLPTVAIDDGFVQVLSDPYDDERILVLYNARGEFLRRLATDVPISLLSRIAGTNMLLAARVTDVRELVGYQWRWSVAQ